MGIVFLNDRESNRTELENEMGTTMKVQGWSCRVLRFRAQGRVQGSEFVLRCIRILGPKAFDLGHSWLSFRVKGLGSGDLTV